MPLEQFDPIACILDCVLGLARTTICEETGYGFINDCSVGETFYVHSNYMCSSFDWSQETFDELQK